MGLGKVVGHEHGDDVSGDLLLHRRSRCTDEANQSRRSKSPTQLRQMSKGRHPGRAPASAAMADRREKNAPHYLTVEWKLAETTPIAAN